MSTIRKYLGRKCKDHSLFIFICQRSLHFGAYDIIHYIIHCCTCCCKAMPGTRIIVTHSWTLDTLRTYRWCVTQARRYRYVVRRINLYIWYHVVTPLEALHSIIRAKRVSNWYTQKKKSVRLCVCSTNLGFSGGSANRYCCTYYVPDTYVPHLPLYY